MFIVFEGIDGGGKTYLSKNLHKKLIESPKHKDENWKWDKEPTFGTEMADELNQIDKGDEFARERLFFDDRVAHQPFLRANNVICDRYIWVGIAYAKIFSPKTYETMREIYLNSKIFIHPDWYVFVDTPIDICLSRKVDFDKNTLEKLRDSYYEVIDSIKQRSKVLIIESIGDPEPIVGHVYRTVFPLPQP